MKFKTLLIISMVILLCFMGCAKEDPDVTGKVEDNPLSEKEIIKYVQDYMYSVYKDDVDVKVLKKNNLTHTTHTQPGLDGGSSIFGRRYAKIKGGHLYYLEITNRKYSITINGSYSDGYTIYNKSSRVSEMFERSVDIDYRYNTMKNEINLKIEFEEFLGSYFTKFHLYKDPGSPDPQVSFYNIYLYGTDDAILSEALSKLVEISFSKYSGCVYEFRAFIFTDEEFYDSFDFDKCNNIDIVNTYRGQSKEDHPDWLTDIDTEYHPEKIIEQYLQQPLTFITHCQNLDHDIFITNGLSGWIEGQKKGYWYNEDLKPEDIEKFEHVIFIYEGDPQTYKNSIEQGDKEIWYAHTDVYGINMNK